MQDSLGGRTYPPSFTSFEFHTWLIREVNSTSLADVGNRFGVDASTIYRWMHGATIPKMAMILGFLYARDQIVSWPEFDDGDAIAGNLSGNAPRDGYDVPNA